MSQPRNLLKDMPEDLDETLDEVIEEIIEEMDDIEDEAVKADAMGDRERAEQARAKIQEARRILRGS